MQRMVSIKNNPAVKVEFLLFTSSGTAALRDRPSVGICQMLFVEVCSVVFT